MKQDDHRLDQVSFKKMLVVWVVITTHCFHPLAAMADVVADSNAAANHRPTIDSTDAGTPVVNITTPSDGGVSRNQYTHFSVDSNGLLLNNNNQQQPASSSQAEIVQQNPNLMGSDAAQVILNEITSTNRSHLNGNIEVVGSQADVVVANPNGISCNGCGFINTSRGVLTTGLPVFGGQGSLESFRVTAGDIFIDGDGLNASDTQQLDLLTRSLQVRGPIWAEELNAITGSNAIDYQTLSLTEINNEDDIPSIGIDVANLGGMYAGKIHLISNEAGVGVNNDGEIGSTVDDVVIDSSGRVSFGGQLSAATDIEINTQEDIEVSGSLYAQEDVALNSENNTSIEGIVEADQDISLSSDSISISEAGTLLSDNELNIDAETSLTNAGQLGAESNINLSAQQITQSGTVTSTNQVTIASESTLTNTGSVHGESMQLQAQTSLNNSGTLSAESSLTAQANAIENTASATIIATHGDLELETGSLSNLGHIENIDGNVNINSQDAINNQASFDANGNLIDGTGNIIAGSDLSIDGQAGFSNSGTVFGGNNSNISVSGNLNNNGLILGTQNLNVTANQIMNLVNQENDGAFISTIGDVVLTANSFIENEGTIFASRDVHLNIAPDFNGTIINRFGSTLEAQGDIALGVACIKDQSGRCADPQNGTLGQGQQVNVINEGAINSQEDIYILAHTFRNNMGPIDINGPAQVGSVVKINEGFTGRYDNLISELDLRPAFGGYHVPFRVSSLYRDWSRYWSTRQSFGNNPYSPTITSHRNLIIRSNAGENIGGTLAAGSALSISSLTGGGSFINRSHKIYQFNYVQQGRDAWSCNADLACVIRNNLTYLGEQNVTTNVEQVLFDSRGGIIQVNNGQFSVSGVAFTNDGDRGENLGVNISGTNQPNADRPENEVQIPNMPIGNNSLFVTSEAPDSNYLYISNPRYKRNVNDALSTDYLLSLLNVNEDDVIRLGDALFEQRLLQDQILNQTGKAWITDAHSVEEQMTLLMDAGFEAANTLDLAIGQPLTDKQLQSLDQDMVWLTTKVVNGVEALVPQLYLSTNTLKKSANGQVLADSMIMDVESLTNDGGGFEIENDAVIIAEKDITNNAGAISAENIALVSTGGNITNKTKVEQIGDGKNYRDVAYQGEISANNALVMSGKTGVNVLGASVSAGGSAVLHSEQGDVNIESLKLETKATDSKHTLGFLSSHSEETVTTTQSLSQAAINVGNGNHDSSQLTIVANGGNVNLKGASVNSTGNINIAANDINITTLNVESHTETQSKSSGIQSTENGIFIGDSSQSSSESTSIAQGSHLDAGNALNLIAQNDILIQGGNIDAKTGQIEARNDINVQAAENTYSYTESSHQSGLSIGATENKNEEGDVTGYSASIGIGASSHNQDSALNEYSNANLAFEDSLNMKAGNTVDIGGLTASITNTQKSDSDAQATQSIANDLTNPTEGVADSEISLSSKDTIIATSIDVESLKSAALQGKSSSVIASQANTGMGTSDNFEVDQSATVGSLNISGNKIVSTKYKNEYVESNQSSNTSVGIGITTTQDSVSGGISVGHDQSNGHTSLTADNITQLNAGNVNLTGTETINLKGVDISGSESVSLKSEGDINISAAETTQTYSSSSSSTHVGIGFEVGISDSQTNLTGSVDASVSLNAGHQSEQANGVINGHMDSRLATGGNLNIVSDQGDVTWVGVSAEASDLSIKGESFSSSAYEDSSQHSENSTNVGVSLTVGTDLGKMADDFLGGNGASFSSLDTTATQEVGNTMLADTATIQVEKNVRVVGGNIAANALNIEAETVDLVAAKSILEEHKTESSVSLTADGSAAIAGNKAYGSIDSLTGKVDSGTIQTSGHADRTGHGKTNNGKAISDELLTGKAGLSIEHRTEDTNSTSYTNATVQSNQLSINTTGNAQSGDGYVDIGGANLLALEGNNGVQSSINIVSGEVRTTKYIDTMESTVHDNSTFIGVSAEAHSAVADTVNHSTTLADKANAGMEVDAGLATAQAAADASNLAMGDLAGASYSLTFRNMDTKSKTRSTSENINYVSADHINIQATQGDITLNGVEFNAPPSYNEATGTMEASSNPRSQSIILNAANNVEINAAKSTYEETSTTLTNDFNATLAGSVSSTGAGLNADIGYNGSRSDDQLNKTSYSNASVQADNVTIKANNISLTGANVDGNQVKVDARNNISITSVQDTQTQSTVRSNYGGSVGAGIGTMGIVPSVNGQGGGGNSYDNSAITQQQSGISADNQLTLNAGGDTSLTGSYIAVSEGGSAHVDIKGDLIASSLEDYREKDGLFAGGGGGIDAGGLNMNVNFEKVDQVKYNANQNATIDVGTGSLKVAGNIDGDVNDNMENAIDVTQDREIAGVYSNGTGFVPRGGARNTSNTSGTTQGNRSTLPNNSTSIGLARPLGGDKVSGHWVNDSAQLPGGKNSQRDSYIAGTTMNIQHNDQTTLDKRAEAMGRFLPAEKKIISDTKKNLQNIESDVFKQSSHMVHQQRGEVSRAIDNGLNPDKNYQTVTKDRPQDGTETYKSLMSMMARGEQGPLTKEQSQQGVQAAGAAHQILRDNRKEQYKTTPRVDAIRTDTTGGVTHPAKTKTGVNLARDVGTQIRDREGLPVMTGTSGTSSDVVRSHLAAVSHTNKSNPVISHNKADFAAPGLSPERAATATKDLTLAWMRDGEFPKTLKKNINKTLTKEGDQVIPKTGDDSTVQTHSYSEIATGVDLTLSGKNDQQAYEKSVSSAKERLQQLRQQLIDDASRYDANVVVVTRKKDGSFDDTVVQSAKDLKNKHPNTTKIVYETAEGKGYQGDDIKGLSGKVRINIVGHGGDVRSKDVKTVSGLIAMINKDMGDKTSIQRVGLVACGKCLKKGEVSYGMELTKALKDQGLTPEVAERTAQLQVNQDGTKVSFDPTGKKPEKLVHRIEGGKLVTKKSEAKRVLDTHLNSRLLNDDPLNDSPDFQKHLPKADKLPPEASDLLNINRLSKAERRQKYRQLADKSLASMLFMGNEWVDKSVNLRTQKISDAVTNPEHLAKLTDAEIPEPLMQAFRDNLGKEGEDAPALEAIQQISEQNVESWAITKPTPNEKKFIQAFKSLDFTVTHFAKGPRSYVSNTEGGGTQVTTMIHSRAQLDVRADQLGIKDYPKSNTPGLSIKSVAHTDNVFFAIEPRDGKEITKPFKTRSRFVGEAHEKGIVHADDIMNLPAVSWMALGDLALQEVTINVEALNNRFGTHLEPQTFKFYNKSEMIFTRSDSKAGLALRLLHKLREIDPGEQIISQIKDVSDFNLLISSIFRPEVMVPGHYVSEHAKLFEAQGVTQVASVKD